MKDTYRRIYQITRRIPHGRVATYGQVARLAGFPGQARLVGYALSALSDDSGVPWHRVVNAHGGISLRSEAGWGDAQRGLLEAERVVFSGDMVSLSRYQWRPRGAGR